MAFITGLVLIDAPASALNNGEGEDTKAKVKSIHVHGQGDFPYVSAQAFRYWLRTGLERQSPEWKAHASPVYSAGAGKKQQAYTAGDPIRYWDDDLLGYMRAEKSETVTRVSPFRTSTLISIAPVSLVDDFGVMARVPKQEGDTAGVLLHGHEFYRTTLQGLFSLDLAAAGTFTNQMRSGYQNLSKDAVTEDGELYALDEQTFRLPDMERIQRIQILIRGIGRLEGGAKQTLHYTDVSPAFIIAAVTTGGNHIFGRIIQAQKSSPAIHPQALHQALTTLNGDILSPIYVGRAEGFMDQAAEIFAHYNIPVFHPRQALDTLADDLAKNPAWLE